MFSLFVWLLTPYIMKTRYLHEVDAAAEPCYDQQVAAEAHPSHPGLAVVIVVPRPG